MEKKAPKVKLSDVINSTEDLRKYDEAIKKAEFNTWKMSYTTEENLPPLERLICELQGTRENLYHQRNLLFWLFTLSMLAHAIR